MKPMILIDGNAVARAHHHANKLAVGSFQTQAIFGIVKTLRDLASTYPLHDMAVLWDGQAEHRFAIYPEYKANRDDSADPKKAADNAAYHAQVPILQKGIELLGLRQLKAENLEADDLAGWMSRTYSQAGRDVLLVTGDSDWLQLVNERVCWFDPRGAGKHVNLDNFLDVTGYHSPFEYLQGKCLVGDASDGIGPVGGIGEKTAPLFMARFKSVEAFWQQCDAGTYTPETKAERSLWKGTSDLNKEQWAATFTGDPGDKKALKRYMDAWPGQGRVLFERNMKLMSLLDASAPERDRLQVRPGNYSPAGFRALCERLAFASILLSWEQFSQPFEQRWQYRAMPAAA